MGGEGCIKQGSSPARRCYEFIRLICHLELNSPWWVSGRGWLHMTPGCQQVGYAAEIMYLLTFFKRKA